MSDCLTLISEDEAQEAFYSYLDACHAKGTDAYSFTITFELTSLQLRRLCALRAALGCEGPEEALGAMLRAGSYSLINERLASAENVVSRMKKTDGASAGKEGA